MPLYFFHLKDGEDTLIDAEGVELADVEAVRKSSLEQARAIVGHEARNGCINLAQRIEVLDKAGTLIYSLEFADAVEVRR